MSDFFEFVRNNFGHVLPILIAAAFAIAIIAERSFALFSRYPIQNIDGFFKKITDLVMAGKVAEAISVCDRMSDKPAAGIVREALLRAHQSEKPHSRFNVERSFWQRSPTSRLSSVSSEPSQV
jgi:hypothetical protein